MAQKRDEMMPAISPVNTLEQMTEHITYANFLCENTQNTWNTYFCEKDWRKAARQNDQRSEPRGLYTRTHVLCVPCVLARQPMIASRVVGQCTREKSDHPPSVRPAASKRAVILFSVGPTSSKPNSVTGLFRPDVVARLGFGLRLRHPDWSDRRRCEW